jgi:DNA-binding HxlR family transcriptional regulator
MVPEVFQTYPDGMGATYHQFCPVAKAMEVLDERWTLLVMREIVLGTEHFNDLRRGVPRMSPSLLSQRLQRLTRAGIIEREEDGDGVRYVPTEAGRELRPVIEALGAWGVRWIPELGDTDLDPHLLLWDMHRNVALDATPKKRTVVAFRFDDVQARDWWIVIDNGDVDVCDADPGYPVTATVSGPLRELIRVHRGDTDWRTALRSGVLSIDGTERVRRELPQWFRPSMFSAVPRPA